MKNLSQVFAAMRNKNRKQYMLLAGCCFFSVLLITAYVFIMRSPTVLNVLPQGGDSRKQIMMIFVLAVIGCGMFTIYASGLFLRYKSKEIGIFLALGISRRQIKNQLIREIISITFVSCFLGALLGKPLAWLIWQGFQKFLIDTEEMHLIFDIKAYLLTFIFSAFVIVIQLFMLSRFISRISVMDMAYQSRKSEQIREVPRSYGLFGILLLIGGLLLGYLAPSFCIKVFHWYPPEGFTSIFYIPAIIGLYMILLHTVVNGWRHGKNRYKNIIPSSIMKFQGRQTVRYMMVVTVLVAGAYFSLFYVPMMGTNAVYDFNTRTVDYAFHYRRDQDMPTETDIRKMAEEEGVTITSYTEQNIAVLGVDGWEYVEKSNSLGTTYTIEYKKMLRSERFLSESSYNALTQDTIDVLPGTVMAVYDDEGSNRGLTTKDISLITNPITKKVLKVVPVEDFLTNSMLFGCKVLDDADYAKITEGLTEEWFEIQVFFNVKNPMNTYNFAKRLFYTIVDCSSPEVAVYDGYDPVVKMLAEEKGEPYFLDRENQEAYGYKLLNYDQRDSSNFRLFWKYMPRFRVLDKVDYIKTHAIFLMSFTFISIICFTAVIVITYIRSITIALTNKQLYDDLRRLGASNKYLYHSIKGQISKMFSVPILVGTLSIYAFYILILYFNNSQFSRNELRGLMTCLTMVPIISLILYSIYRKSLKKACMLLNISTDYYSKHSN